MRGYYTENGYMGYVLGKGYQLFDSEDSYIEWEFENFPEIYTYLGEGEQ